MSRRLDTVWVARLFRELSEADLRGGTNRSLLEYERLFPGHEALIRRCYERQRAGDAVPLNDSRSDPAATAWRLGTYTLLSRIGRGGQGEIYLARDPLVDRRVVLKVLPLRASFERNSRRRFVREARALADFDHPGICRFLHLDEDNGVHFLVLEYVPGRTLLAETRPEGPVPRRVFDDWRAALAHAHARGWAHGDVHPRNLWVTTGDRGVLLDFGMARRITSRHGDAARRDVLDLEAAFAARTPQIEIPTSDCHPSGLADAEEGDGAHMTPNDRTTPPRFS